MTQRARILVPVVLLLVAAALLWIASRVVWLDVVAFNDQSGEDRRSLLGADWQPVLVPLALGAVAAVAAVALVRGLGARVVGGVIALLGIAAGGVTLSGLGEPDVSRAHAAITSTDEIGRTNAGPGVDGTQSVPEWSEVTDLTVRPLGSVLTGASALTLIVAGAFGMVRPARRVQQDARYVTPAARREATRVGGAPDGEPDGAASGAAGGDGPGPADARAGASSDDSGRDLWQELDEGRDPTD